MRIKLPTSRKSIAIIGLVSLAIITLIYAGGLAFADLRLTKGRLVWGDGLFYYEYLPSFLAGQPFDFCSLREKLIVEGIPYNWEVSYLRPTPSGKCGTVFSFGWALLVSPFFLIAHLISLALHPFNGARVDGYGFIYESITVYGAVFIGFLSTVTLYRIARLFLSRDLSLFAAALVFLSSNAVYYATVQASMSHVAGFFCVSATLYCWLKVNIGLDKKYVYWCGLFALLAIFVRPQLATIALVILTQMLWRTRSIAFIAPMLAFILGAVVIELAIWYIIFGKLIFIPHGEGFLSAFDPQIIKVLFSLNHGLFLWHPIYLIALIGFGLSGRIGISSNLVVFILIAICSQIYINSIASDWWAGNSFGNRRFVDILPLFFVGLICLVKSSNRSWLMCICAAAFVVWNFLFVIQYRFGFIPRGEAITVQQLTVDKFRLPKIGRVF